MKQVLVNESSLQDIANAIREKTEGTEPILPSEMGNVIRAMEMGGELKYATGTLRLSANGTSLSVNGVGFIPAVVFCSHDTYEEYFLFGSANAVRACYGSSFVTATFSVNSDGFTFSSSTWMASSGTYTWYAFGI